MDFKEFYSKLKEYDYKVGRVCDSEKIKLYFENIKRYEKMLGLEYDFYDFYDIIKGSNSKVSFKYYVCRGVYNFKDIVNKYKKKFVKSSYKHTNRFTIQKKFNGSMFSRGYSGYVNIKGKNNPRYCGLTNEEIIQIIKKEFLGLDYPVNGSDYRKIAKEQGLPLFFDSEFRKDFNLFEVLNDINQKNGFKLVLPKDKFLIIQIKRKRGLFMKIYKIRNQNNKNEYHKDSILNVDCGEILFGGAGVCNLGSLNLTQFVTENNEFDFQEFKRVIPIAVRFLDNINDIARVPLQKYKDSIKEKRRIGLGVMGLGSLHYMLGIRFGSEKSLELIEKIYKTKSETEILSSALLGQEKGSFPLFDKEKYFNTYWWKTLPISDEVKKRVEEIGEMRNSHRAMNAPTGNTSILAGIVSGGIEPVFLKEYIRWSAVTEHEQQKLKEEGFSFPNVHRGEWFETDYLKFTKKNNEDILKGKFKGVDYEVDKSRGLIKATMVEDYGWRYVKEKGLVDKYDKNVFVTTMDLTVAEHIKTLEVISKYTDFNNSKTINIRNDYPFNSFKDVYISAWKAGIKGVTTYRDGTMMAVLEEKNKIEEEKNEFEEVFRKANGNIIKDNIKLPTECYSKLFVIRSNDDGTGKKWYVHIAFSDKSLKRPFAIFVSTNSRESSEVTNETINALEELALNVGIRRELVDEHIMKQASQSNVTKIARTIGLLLRHNCPIYKIVEVLDKGDYPLGSFTFHIKRLLKKFIKEGQKATNQICPECGSNDIVYKEGCLSCNSCFWSKCG